MQLDKSNTLLGMRIVLEGNKKDDILNYDKALEDIYKMFIEPQNNFINEIHNDLKMVLPFPTCGNFREFITKLEDDFINLKK